MACFSPSLGSKMAARVLQMQNFLGYQSHLLKVFQLGILRRKLENKGGRTILTATVQRRKFVCLFFMHLSTVRASVVKLSRNSPLVQEKVESYFCPENYKSFPSQKTPSVSNQLNCSIPFSDSGQVIIGFRGCSFRICGSFG